MEEKSNGSLFSYELKPANQIIHSTFTTVLYITFFADKLDFYCIFLRLRKNCQRPFLDGNKLYKTQVVFVNEKIGCIKVSLRAENKFCKG